MRKQPQQARSRETTTALLDAATHILGRKGWAGLTTNEVASVAGTSIGSLYQYFPNKFALVEAVRERHFADLLAVLKRAAGNAHDIDAFVDGMIALHCLAPSAHRVLIEDVPRGAHFIAAHRAFRFAYERSWEDFVAAHVSQAGPSSRSIVARVLAGALSGAIHDAAERGVLSSAPLRTELIRFVSSYIAATRQHAASGIPI